MNTQTRDPESLFDIGGCWQCDESIVIPFKYYPRTQGYQMLFCCQECADASRREGNDYGIGLIIKRNPR